MVRHGTPTDSKPVLKVFTSSSGFVTPEPASKGTRSEISIRSEGVENLSPAPVGAPPRGEDDRASGSAGPETVSSEPTTSEGRAEGKGPALEAGSTDKNTMAALIKRFREAPPLSKAERTSEGMARVWPG